MPVVSHRYRLVYFPLPKIASSSLKCAMYELDTGRQFKNIKHGDQVFDIHNLYPAAKSDSFEPFYSSYFSFTVVRDPVERLLSVHKHRIGAAKDLERQGTPEELRRRSLPLAPDLNEFLLNVEGYMNSSWMIDHHASRQRQFLPKNIEWMNAILPLEKVGCLTDMIERHTGRRIAIPHFNRTNAGELRGQISSAAMRHIEELFAEDIALYQRALERHDWR